MAIEFPCDGCRRLLRAGVEAEGQKVRCPGCRTVCIVPPLAANQMQDAKGFLVDEDVPVGEVEEEVPEVGEVEEEPFSARLAHIDRAIDDINLARRPRRSRSAAALVKDGPCPNCRKPMKAGDVLCIECGFDLRKGKIRGLKLKRFQRDWIGGFPIWAMILITTVVLTESGMLAFILLQASVVVALVLAPIVLLLGMLVVAVTGWFNVLHLSRDRQGTLWLSLRRHFAFIPYAFEDVAVKKYKAVVIGHRPGMDVRRAVVFIILILPHLLLLLLLLIASIRFIPRGYFFWRRYDTDSSGSSSIFGDTYWVALRDLRRREVRIYYGGNGDLMRDLVDALADAGDLEIVR
jgi:hypothetical protein